MIKFPAKQEREEFEAGHVTTHLKRYGFGKVEVLEFRERPDVVLQCQESGQKIGVELTSVYVSDRSVPDRHLNPESIFIPDDPIAVSQLKARLLDKIRQKVERAQKDYQTFDILILAVFMNEYETVYFQREDWDEWLHQPSGPFLPIHPFTHLLMWDERGSAIFGEIEDMQT